LQKVAAGGVKVEREHALGSRSESRYFLHTKCICQYSFLLFPHGNLFDLHIFCIQNV
jgi:hypothetical protein